MLWIIQQTLQQILDVSQTPSMSSGHHSEAHHGKGREVSNRSSPSTRSRKPGRKIQNKKADTAVVNKPGTEAEVFTGLSHDDSAEPVEEEMNTHTADKVDGNHVTPSAVDVKSLFAESVATDINIETDNNNEDANVITTYSNDDTVEDDVMVGDEIKGRPKSGMAAYTDVIDPEDFDSRTFLSGISDLSMKLQSESYLNIDSEFPAAELQSMVSAVRVTFNNFSNYTNYCQGQMEGVRSQMKNIKDKMHKRIHHNQYDPNTGRQQTLSSLTWRGPLPTNSNVQSSEGMGHENPLCEN